MWSLSSDFIFTWLWLLCGYSHGCFPVKSPNYFIAEAPSNPLLNLPFNPTKLIVRPSRTILPYFDKRKQYLGGKPDSPDMGCCKHVLGINVFRGPPCTTSRWTTLAIFCWKEMAAIFQNGRHVKVILRNIQDNVRTEPHFTMCWVSY